MAYTIRSADGLEREYKLEDIIAGVAAGNLRREWLVRCVGDEGWMSVETLLRIREDGRRIDVPDNASVAKPPFLTAGAQPRESVLGQDVGSTVLQPRVRQVGGWLILLILWFAFWVPAGVKGDTAAIEKLFALLVDQHAALSTLSSICILLSWTTAIVSLYCAYVLAFRKPGAIVVARRGLIFIAVLQFSLYGMVALLVQPVLLATSLAVLAKPLVWLAIWYTYLVRSKRVRETYLA